MIIDKSKLLELYGEFSAGEWSFSVKQCKPEIPGEIWDEEGVFEDNEDDSPIAYYYFAPGADHDYDIINLAWISYRDGMVVSPEHEAMAWLWVERRAE